MKLVRLTPTIIALLVLICSPFGFATACGPAHPEGLVCYCCSGQGLTCNCTLFSCPKRTSDTGAPDYGRAPEYLRPFFEMIVHFQPVITDPELFYPPETVYQKVQVKPPPPFTFTRSS